MKNSLCKWTQTSGWDCVHPDFLSGDAGLLTDQRGHPGGLGRDAVVPGRHAGQRRFTGSTTGPAKSLDVELDPGERPPSFPEPPRGERRSATSGGEGYQGSHIPRPGRRPAAQDRLDIIGTPKELMPDGTRKRTASASDEICTKWKEESPSTETFSSFKVNQLTIVIFLNVDSNWTLDIIKGAFI